MERRFHKLKEELGQNLLILAHYYQGQAIQDAADIVGDSYKLSVAAKNAEARYIIFCGVRFMAETAAVLSKQGQHVYLPAVSAECEMAKMVDAQTLHRIYNQNKALQEHFVPVVYVNSTAEVKAFAGKYNGVSCTSSNAQIIVSSLLQEGKGVFFIPDRNLGMNVAAALDVHESEVALVTEEGASITESTRYCIWNGYCPVHHFMSVANIKNARRTYPEAHVIVHPECQPDVVQLSDYAGSTSGLLSYIENTAPEDYLVVGTEYNFVESMKKRFPGKHIVHLKPAMCMDMHAINLDTLVDTLQDIYKGKLDKEITVSPLIKDNAKSTIDRMIQITETYSQNYGGKNT
ncbi:MAG: quinolinate synthase [Spirochaetia bacterium]